MSNENEHRLWMIETNRLRKRSIITMGVTIPLSSIGISAIRVTAAIQSHRATGWTGDPGPVQTGPQRSRGPPERDGPQRERRCSVTLAATLCQATHHPNPNPRSPPVPALSHPATAAGGAAPRARSQTRPAAPPRHPRRQQQGGGSAPDPPSRYASPPPATAAGGGSAPSKEPARRHLRQQQGGAARRARSRTRPAATPRRHLRQQQGGQRAKQGAGPA